MSEEEQITDEEREELKKLLGGASAPIPDDKQNIHTFITKVLTAKDTTKTGNLTEMEIGMMRNPVRAYKEEEVWARHIIKCEELAQMFAAQSEITTSTSLSRGGTLLKVATTTTRNIADLSTPKQSTNSGWFKKKEEHKPGSSI
jgi:hypothetical protein